VSTINWSTTFSNDDENFVNGNFNDLLAARPIISARLGQADNDRSQPTDSAFWSGYGATSQDVIIPPSWRPTRGAMPAR
jgi:hypothetical protein